MCALLQVYTSRQFCYSYWDSICHFAFYGNLDTWWCTLLPRSYICHHVLNFLLTMLHEKGKECIYSRIYVCAIQPVTLTLDFVLLLTIWYIYYHIWHLLPISIFIMFSGAFKILSKNMFIFLLFMNNLLIWFFDYKFFPVCEKCLTIFMTINLAINCRPLLEIFST